jgi:hypothetical protein
MDDPPPPNSNIGLTLPGFAVVGEYESESIKEAQATAYEQMLKWVKDH